jgi:hypothetical protein
MWKIENKDGTLWKTIYKSKKDAKKDLAESIQKYAGMLAGQPHKIIRVINQEIRYGDERIKREMSKLH